MLYFHNPGLIDLMAVRTIGVSVKLPNAFGRFGTGINYGIATALRGGASIVLYRGKDRHEFTVQPTEIRGETFDIVCLDGVPMGFTTALGKDWQPWMVLREFGCNARDENGDFWSSEQGKKFNSFKRADHTLIVIEWPDLDDAWRNRGDLFLEGEPIYANEKVRILPGPSPHLFYRGVRVFKLEKPAIYSYDILSEQQLTEDRSLYGEYTANALIREAMLELDSKAALEPVLCAGEGYYEGKFDFATSARLKTPTRAFLDTVMEARERGDRKLNASAKTVLQKQMRRARSEAGKSYGGGSYHRAINDAFAFAIQALEELDVKFPGDQEFITTNELPEGVLSMVEDGRVYVHNDLLRQDARAIAEVMLKRWADINGLHSADSLLNLLGPKLLDQHKGMVAVLAAIEEDAKPKAA